MSSRAHAILGWLAILGVTGCNERIHARVEPDAAPAGIGGVGGAGGFGSFGGATGTAGSAGMGGLGGDAGIPLGSGGVGGGMDAGMDAGIDAATDLGMDQPCVVALQFVCDPHAICVASGGPATCYCPMGFLDVSAAGASGIVCVDVDECRAGLDACDENAGCMNVPGSYQCFCQFGFSGNGFTCVNDADAGTP